MPGVSMLRPRSVLRGCAALGVALATGCQSTYYDEYRAANPGFRAELPREGAGLRETLASLHAPSPDETIETGLEELLVFDVTQPDWQAIPFEEIRAGAALAADGSFAVVATTACRSVGGLREERARRTAWYLLPGNRLDAWDHYDFRSRCVASNAFRAARGAQVPLERELTARVAARGQAARVDLVEAYRRGLAYVEAGRLDEARAMLTVGEAGYRAATQRLRVGERAPEPLVEATRLRRQLMRSLGVAPR